MEHIQMDVWKVRDGTQVNRKIISISKKDRDYLLTSQCDCFKIAHYHSFRECSIECSLTELVYLDHFRVKRLNQHMFLKLIMIPF